MIRFFNPGKSYLKHREEYLKEIDRVLINGDLILRKDLEDFEKSLAGFCGKKYATGLNSGTDALYLSLRVCGVKTGDEVIISAHTFVASVQVIVLLGARPVFVDMGEEWRDYITAKTKAVMPCHIAGEVLDWEPVNGITMIDDSCQGLGARGFRGAIQCWSFYPAKLLGSFGDGGGITTDNEQYARDIKDLGNHWKSDYTKWGVNSRLDNLQAAILNIKMKYLKETLARRREIAERYTAGLIGVDLPKQSEGRVWQDYIIRVPKRDALYEHLRTKGIETMKNDYPFPIIKPSRSFEYERSTLRLPINEVLENDEIDEVIKQINTYVA